MVKASVLAAEAASEHNWKVLAVLPQQERTTRA